MTIDILKIMKNCQKADLHRHLDGLVRLDTLLDIIHKQKIIPKNPAGETYWTEDTLPDMEALKKIVCCGKHTLNLNMYLRSFDISCACMQTEENLKRIVYEAIEDAHNDNITYVEFRYAPGFHTAGGLKEEEVIDIVCKEAARVVKECIPTIEVRFIACALKFVDLNSAKKITDLVIARKGAKNLEGELVAFDLAGPENVNPIEYYSPVLEEVYKSGQCITIHAGEASGPKSVMQAILCHAMRIGHGVRISEDKSVCDLVRDKKIVLEMCPTSNIHTKAEGVAEDLSNYPLKKYMHNGIRVTVATDNPTVSSCTLSGEYEVLTKATNLSAAEILVCMDNAFASGFFKDNEIKNKFRKQAWDNNVKVLSEMDPEVESKANAIKEKFNWE